MAHELIGQYSIDVVNSQAGKQFAINRWVYPEILSNRSVGPETRSTSAVTQYVYGRFYFDDRQDPNAILRVASEGVGSYASWYQITYQWVPTEYLEPECRDDPEYYHPTLQTGLRTDPSINVVEDMTISVSPVSYRINDTNYETSHTDISLSQHTTTQRIDRLVVREDETVTVIEGTPSTEPAPPVEPDNTVTIGLITLFPSEISSIETKTQYEQYDRGDRSVWAQSGTVPNELTQTNV